MPKAIESEMAVLGCIIRDENLLSDAQKYILSKDMFYDSGTQRLFQIITKLKEDSKPIDPVILCSMITANDKKKYEISDTYYITGLLDEGFNGRVESYSRIVAEKYYQRELIKDAEKIQTYCLDNSVKYEEIIKKVNVITSNLQSLNTGKDFDLIKTGEELHGVRSTSTDVPYDQVHFKNVETYQAIRFESTGAGTNCQPNPLNPLAPQNCAPSGTAAPSPEGSSPAPSKPVPPNAPS